MLAAITRRPGALVILGPRQRIVTPLAGHRVGAVDDTAVDDDAAAATRADDHAEHTGRTGTRAVRRFRQRKTICIVRQPHFAPEHALEVDFHRLLIEASGVGIAHQAGGRRQRPWRADADGGWLAEFTFRIADQSGDQRQRGRVILRGRGLSPAQQLPARVVERGDLGFGAAKVDAYFHGGTE